MANATLRYQTITTLTTNKQMSNYILYILKSWTSWFRQKIRVYQRLSAFTPESRIKNRRY